MNTKASELLIRAVETAFIAAQNKDNPKDIFCKVFAQSVDEIHKQKLLSDEEYQQIVNSREDVYYSAMQQLRDDSPHTMLKGMRTSVGMFGPQFIIDPSLRGRIIAELGHCPIWAVISTFGTDTMYAGLTFPEAVHRAQVEALEIGRQASVVLQLEQFRGPPLFGNLAQENLY